MIDGVPTRQQLCLHQITKLDAVVMGGNYFVLCSHCSLSICR